MPISRLRFCLQRYLGFTVIMLKVLSEIPVTICFIGFDIYFGNNHDEGYLYLHLGLMNFSSSFCRCRISRIESVIETGAYSGVSILNHDRVKHEVSWSAFDAAQFGYAAR